MKQQGTARRIGLAGLLSLAIVGSVEAGIVILDNGHVIVGKLRASDVKPNTLTVRWPHGSRTQQGKIEIERAEVRWFDADADQPRDAYWRKHLDDPLVGATWLRQRQEYIERQRAIAEQEKNGGILVPPPKVELFGSLEPSPKQGEGFTIQMPRGWTAKSEDGVLMLRAPKTRGRGFRPKIHVFSVPAAKASYEAQVDWVRAELNRLAGTEGFKIVELDRLRLQSNGQGANQTMKTETKLTKRTVAALRTVAFRGARTYFVAAYADARDYDGVENLFRDVLRTWRIAEDTAK